MRICVVLHILSQKYTYKYIKSCKQQQQQHQQINNNYCNGDTYHNSNLNIKLNGRGFYDFYKWQEHVQVM